MSDTLEYLYKGVYVHLICRIHGLKLGITPGPEPEPEYKDGVCTICQMDGPQDCVQAVCPPSGYDGLRLEVNKKPTGVTYLEK